MNLHSQLHRLSSKLLVIEAERGDSVCEVIRAEGSAPTALVSYRLARGECRNRIPLC